MPIFDFVCRACGREFELLLLGSDKPKCPACQSVDLRKRLSAFASPRSGGGEGSGSGCAGCSGGNCAGCR